MGQHTDLILLVGRMDAKVNNLFENDKGFKETIAGIDDDLKTHKIEDKKKQKYIYIWVGSLTLIILLIALDNKPLYNMLNKLFDLI